MRNKCTFGTMRISVAMETSPGERRVALTPASCQQLTSAGHSITVASNAGLAAGFEDAAYINAGAQISTSLIADLKAGDVLIKVAVPTAAEIAALPRDVTLISYLYPRRHPELLAALAAAGVNGVAVDAMPRISRAQNMDVLSSQNNLAGYKAVIAGANEMGKIFPLMMTAAGTIAPSRVLIYGAGVAGLQAIATAKRLGAIVEVSDVRPETKEQVESLGAKFVSVEGLDQVKIEGGYVAQISDEMLARQKEAVEKVLINADLVITTALVQGGKAPCLITEDQVKKMKRGSVIVDMATEAGGNCECSVPDQTVVKHGVTIIGANNLAASTAQNASELYGKNLVNFLKHAATADGMTFDTNDEITSAVLVVYNGQVRV